MQATRRGPAQRRSSALKARDTDSYLLVEPGTVIFQEGERGFCAYMIERGRVEISVERSGQKIVLANRGPGEVFGEMAIIDDKPRSATVTALQPCDLLLITREQLTNRIQQTDPVLRMCLSVILERFRATLLRLQLIHHDELPPLAPEDNDQAPASVHDHAIREIKLERELHRALRQDEFELHYQPIVHLANGALAGFEALIRWRHEERGLIAPTVFIPTAEASGLIVPIGRWGFKRACLALTELSACGSPGARPSPPLFMSVNFSARDFSDSTFLPEIRKVLDETGVEPTAIKIEITESLLMNEPEVAAASLRSCNDLGIHIAIDDFGTGYSSLSYLHKFPIDTIKIDRSFICNMHECEDSAQIVGSIVHLANGLGIEVVAEGIEDPEHVSLLQGLGCHFGQGYLFAKPLPIAEALAFTYDQVATSGASAA
jgi:EAL domain-containing protein (putative c-di-GMP-specific phosphodiesterase class I)